MSFAVGNFVTLRLFILVLHFFSAEWISGSQFSVHSNIWMQIGRKLFEYSKRKKGKTRCWKKGITATQKGTHNTARASRPSGKRAPFFGRKYPNIFKGITANNKGTDGHGRRWPSINSSPELLSTLKNLKNKPLWIHDASDDMYPY